jgi:hypothetical protein
MEYSVKARTAKNYAFETELKHNFHPPSMGQFHCKYDNIRYFIGAMED